MAELPVPPTPTLDAIHNVYLKASQGDGFRDDLGASLIGKGGGRRSISRISAIVR
jgi:hypothetical protein